LRVEAIRPDWELREGLAIGGSVIPDLLVRLRQPAATGDKLVLRCVFEIDLGTEPLGVLTRKFRTYAGLRGSREGLFGWRSFSLVVVAPSQADSRRKQIARLLAREWSGPSAVVAEARELWTALPRVFGLPDSPYGLPLGKGRAEAGSYEFSTESPAVDPVLYGSGSCA
jgi:hypothetical protein